MAVSCQNNTFNFQSNNSSQDGELKSEIYCPNQNSG
jgi:hypothetical protein